MQQREAEPLGVGVEVVERGGEHDDADGRVALAHGLDHLEPAHPWHQEVGEHEVVAAGPEPGDPLGPVRRDVGRAAPGRQEIPEHLPEMPLVVDHEDTRGTAWAHRALPRRLAWQGASGARTPYGGSPTGINGEDRRMNRGDFARDASPGARRAVSGTRGRARREFTRLRREASRSARVSPCDFRVVDECGYVDNSPGICGSPLRRRRRRRGTPRGTRRPGARPRTARATATRPR